MGAPPTSHMHGFAHVVAEEGVALRVHPPSAPLSARRSSAVLLRGVGCAILGFCIMLAVTMWTRDTRTAFNIGLYHAAMVPLLTAASFLGGPTHKLLLVSRAEAS
jgi:hypothetical protein